MIAYNTSIVRDGLVLYLDAANVKSYPGSGTVWKDLSGLGNNGTLVNGVGYSADNKGAMVFDGVNDYADGLSGAVTDTSAITLCVWNNGQVSKPSSAFWFTDSANGYNRVCQAHLPGSDNIVFFDCGVSGSSTYDRIFKTVTDSEYKGWHYWVFVKDVLSGIMSIFLDGTLWHSDTGKTLPLRMCDVGKIGSSAGGDIYHNGRISSFAIYNRALTVNEIRQNFEATRSRYGI